MDAVQKALFACRSTTDAVSKPGDEAGPRAYYANVFTGQEVSKLTVSVLKAPLVACAPAMPRTFNSLAASSNTDVTAKLGCVGQVAQILVDAKTDDVVVLDVRNKGCSFADEMVIATARSKLHCQSAAQAVVYRVCFAPCRFLHVMCMPKLITWCTCLMLVENA